MSASSSINTKDIRKQAFYKDKYIKKSKKVAEI